MSTYGGTNIFCPFCKDVQVCSSVYKSGVFVNQKLSHSIIKI